MIYAGFFYKKKTGHDTVTSQLLFLGGLYFYLPIIINYLLIT